MVQCIYIPSLYFAEDCCHFRSRAHILLENFVIDLSLDFKHCDNSIISFDILDEITTRNFFARFKLKYALHSNTCNISVLYMYVYVPHYVGTFYKNVQLDYMAA